MSGSTPSGGNHGARSDTWDRDCTGLSGVLLLAGGLTAVLRGQAQLGEVCTLLGAVFLAVAARLWVAPHRRRPGALAPAGEPAAPPEGGAADPAGVAEPQSPSGGDAPQAGIVGSV